MKRLIARLYLSCLISWTAWSVSAADLTWFTDLAKAQAQAKSEQKTVLLYFHGSDWCPTCVEFQQQVIQTPEFIHYARQALVLVDVDFPDKVKQAATLKRANLALQARYNIAGYPTLVLVDEAGKTLFQEVDYHGGGPAEVLPNLKKHAPLPATPGTAAQFNNLSVAEFAQLAADKANVILDVRTAEEFAEGHIAGAVNLDVSAPGFAAKAQALDQHKTYLVHCASGARSVRACTQLAQLHFAKLYNLTGGIKAWTKAGMLVEK